jgi:moderate conductance mechanosensitive channel
MDVISGIFYLLDDAFRVSEFIQSGSCKGTTESFSLPSSFSPYLIILRHHRGPVYTLPSSELGPLENMSRHGVID